MIHCSYCSKPIKYNTYHNLGSTRFPCPESWEPWNRLDHKAVKRGEWFIRFMPLPLYHYVVKHRTLGFRIIPTFAPYVTAPQHHRVWDEVYKRLLIDPGATKGA